MSHDTKTIRVSMNVYNKLCELGKTNDTFSSVLTRIFEENKLYAVVEVDKN